MLTTVTSYVVCIIILEVNSMAANIILDQIFCFLQKCGETGTTLEV